MKRRVFIKRAVIVAIAVPVIGYVFGIRALAFPGESMAPTVRAGDTLIALVAPWHARSVSRFDMVIFDLPPEFEKENQAWHRVPWMKRLLGLPGEHVQIDPTGIFINGLKLELPKPLVLAQLVTADPTMKWLDVELGPDEYFVIGDKPTSSVDSRSMGPLKRQFLKGYVWKVIHHR